MNNIGGILYTVKNKKIISFTTFEISFFSKTTGYKLVLRLVSSLRWHSQTHNCYDLHLQLMHALSYNFRLITRHIYHSRCFLKPGFVNDDKIYLPFIQGRKLIDI